MNDAILKEIDSLNTLKLPALQARFAEVIGEQTKAPNRKYLIRRITEALEARALEAPAPAPEPAPDEAAKAPKLTKLSVEELRALYLEVLGRPTSSVDKGYLVWKIRMAQQGKVPVGPREQRQPSAEPKDVKVLPLRMEATLVEQLDGARERLGLRSRMELFRRALQAFLLEAGEVRVAELFAAPSPSEPSELEA